MPGSTDVVDRHPGLRRYVLADERVVLAVRRHWARLAEPAVTAVVGLAVAALVAQRAEAVVGEGAVVVLWLGLVPLVRFGWRLLEWRVEWFVATDRRMLLLTGLVTHRVAMMPLHKVTDMSYTRSPAGLLLGYGEFVLESAGQDQAMRRIGWVASPDETYRRLCATIFAPGQPRGVPGIPGLPGMPGLPGVGAPVGGAGTVPASGVVSVPRDEVPHVPDLPGPPAAPPSFPPTSVTAVARGEGRSGVADTQPIATGTDAGEAAWAVDGSRTPFVVLGGRRSVEPSPAAGDPSDGDEPGRVSRR